MNQLQLFDAMARIRRFEERALTLAAEGAVAGSVHVCAGQEAIPVGALEALTDADRVLATYRGHGWALACGVPAVALLGEICQKSGGINGGRAGSPLLCAPGHGFLGENSIVGAGVPIAAGVAIAAQRIGDGVAVVSIGDGAMNQGAVHEALAFAAARSLPLIVICENNGWAEMTPARAMIRGSLVDRAAAYGIVAREVDGNDPEAVRDAVAEARATAVAGNGPVFLECRTVRLLGHYNRDIEHYRTSDDREDAQAREPLVRLRATLVADGTATDEELDARLAAITADLDDVAAAVVAMSAPTPDDAVAVTAPATDVAPPPATDRKMVELTYQKAVNAALRDELAMRPEVLVYGEDVAAAGGIFGITRGLQDEFGEDRVFDTPIAEAAILGSAVGAAMRGLRPVVEIMWADFLLVALDQLVNQAANVRYVSGGELTAPLVVRTQQGVTPGSCAQHSQSLEALLAHIPGLKVGLPATPADAYAMLRAAVADPDPCVLLESRAAYQVSGEVALGAGLEAVGGARLRRPGADVAIVTWGPMVAPSLAAAADLAAEGVEAAVLDLRWLRPLDVDAIAAAVRAAGGRVVVVHEANLTGGFGAEIAAHIQEEHFDELDAPVARLGTPDVRMPAAPSLQQAIVPDAAAITARCRALVGLGTAV